MHRLRNYILCVLLTIFLFFTAIAVQGAVFAKYSVLDTKTYTDVIEKENISDKVYNTIYDHYETEYNATGVPIETYTSVIDADTTKEIVIGCITDAFSFIKGDSNKLDYKICKEKLVPLKESIDKFFEDYADSINYEKDDAFYKKTASVYEASEEFIMDASDVYKFLTIDSAGYFKYAQKVYSYIDTAVMGSVIATAVLIIILIIANIRKIVGALYWISISAGSSSLLIMGVCIYLKATDYFDRFAIKAPPVFAAMTGLFNKLTDQLIMVNAIIIAVSLVFMIIYIFAGKDKTLKASQAA